MYSYETCHDQESKNRVMTGVNEKDEKEEKTTKRTPTPSSQKRMERKNNNKKTSDQIFHNLTFPLPISFIYQPSGKGRSKKIK